MADNLPDAEVERLLNEVDHVRIRTEEHLKPLIETAAEGIERTPAARHEEFIELLATRIREAIASPTKRCFECGGSGKKQRGRLVPELYTCSYCNGKGQVQKLKLNTKF